MVFLEMLELMVAGLVVFFVITQILIPLGRKTPYFPFFRSKMRKLETDLGQAKEGVEAARLEQETRRERAKAKRIRK